MNKPDRIFPSISMSRQSGEAPVTEGFLILGFFSVQKTPNQHNKTPPKHCHQEPRSSADAPPSQADLCSEVPLAAGELSGSPEENTPSKSPPPSPGGAEHGPSLRGCGRAAPRPSRARAAQQPRSSRARGRAHFGFFFFPQPKRRGAAGPTQPAPPAVVAAAAAGSAGGWGGWCVCV